MFITIVFFLSIAAIFLCLELITIKVFGWPIKKRDSYQIEKQLIYTHLTTDEILSSNVVSWPYIAKLSTSILFKYYVSGTSDNYKKVVWRFSGLSNKIQQRFIDLRIDKLNR